MARTGWRDDLWAITCYFNPMGYARRRLNYQRFRERLRAPLLTVELAYGGDFEVGADAATRVVRLRTDQVLWQKERLLNLAIGALPPECRKVAWLDCDVVFARDDWPERASRALDDVVLIQPFTRVYDLRRDAGRADLRPDRSVLARDSMASKAVGGTLDGEEIRTCSLSSFSPGHAWAMRRDALERVGLYDAMIVGSADNVIGWAAAGRLAAVPRAYEMNHSQAGHYLAWARGMRDVVNGSIGCLEGDLYHLWHGDLEDRGYGERYSDLRRFDFDPHADIAIDANGCWRWNSDKHDLHEYVRAYFASRWEDGRPAPSGS